MTDKEPVLARLERQLLRGLAAGSEVHEVAAFRVFLWPHGDVFYRNRAVPVRAAAHWPSAIAAMVDLFARVGRVPRLEFFAERWPDLGPALAAAGFRCEMSAPALILAPTVGAEIPGAATVLVTGDMHSGFLARYLRCAEDAFNPSAAEPDPDEVTRFRAELISGVTVAAAWVEAGLPVSGASLIGVGTDAELAAVWTAPSHRRRGLAERVCRRLLSAFAQTGGQLVWLSAGDPVSERLYYRIGFGPVGTQLNYARP